MIHRRREGKQARMGNVVLAAMVTTAGMATLLLGAFWLGSERFRYREEVRQYRERFVDTQKQTLQTLVDGLVSEIDYEFAQSDAILRSTLQQRTEEGWETARHLVKYFGPRIPQGVQEEMVKEALRQIRFFEGRGFFFAFDTHGVERLAPHHPHLEGQNVMEIMRRLGDHGMQEMIQLAREQGEGFYENPWVPPGGSGTPLRRIAYVKFFEPFGWVLGSGAFLEDMMEQQKSRILKRVESMQPSGRDHYFVGTWDGMSLLGPGQGRNMSDVKSEDGVMVVRELITAARSGGGFLQYMMPAINGGASYPKLAYARSVDAVQWYVGAGLDMGEVHKRIQREQAQLNRRMVRELLSMAGILLLILCGVVVTATLVTRRLRRDLSAFNAFFEDALNRSTTMDEQQLHYQEFIPLAQAANHMVRELKETEQNLLDEKRLIEAILHSLPGICYVFGADRRLIRWNRGLERVMGLEGEALKKMTVDAFVTPKDRETARHAIEVAEASGSVVVEIQLNTAQGPRSYLFSAVLTEVQDERLHVGVAIDMTDQRVAEQDLARTQALLAAAVDQTPAGILIADAPHGHIRLANAAALRMVNALNDVHSSLHDALASSAWKVHHPDGKPYEPREWPLARAIHQGQVVANEEAIITASEGPPRWVLANAAPVHDETGAIVAGVVVFADISDRKHAEEELKRYREHLEDLVKVRTSELENEVEVRRRTEWALQEAKDAAEVANRAKSRFLANMSHELRTPMNAILGFSQWLLKDPSWSEDQRKQLEIIHLSGKHLLALINDVLDMSKIEAGRMNLEREVCELRDLVDEVSQMIRARTLKKGLAFEVSRVDPLPRWVETDVRKLRQIILNLLSNAVKFTDRGSIFVTLKSKALNPESCLLMVTVEDTGAGIPEGELDRVFDPFVQGEYHAEPKEGTGLGLTISRQFARLMGGDLKAWNRQHGGAAFQLQVPVGIPASQNATERTDNSPKKVTRVQPVNREYRVLIVDDDPHARQLLRRNYSPPSNFLPSRR